MRKPAAVLGTLALAASLTSMPAPAQAATSQFGNACTAVTIVPDVTLVATAGPPSSTLSATAPATGVITAAAFSLPSDAGSGTYPQKVKVARPAAGGQYTVVAETAPLPVAVGTGPFAVRVPVRAGDVLALSGASGASGALACDAPGSQTKQFDGDVPVGTTTTTSSGDYNGVSIPLVATIEPDVDKDGYGDVTQDQCPQSAASQTACPKLDLDVFGVGQGNKILALVNAGSPARVTVTGVAKVDGKKVKLKSRPKQVKPGRFGRFTLRLPAELRSALATLPASRSVAVKITATAPQPGTEKKVKDTATVRLRGTR